MPRSTEPKFPGNRDLVSQIKFDTEQGKIWLNEQRMLLVHSSLFANLRRELVATLGMPRARGMLMRLGYHSGWRDASLAPRLRPDLATAEAFYAGPQLALIKGMVNVAPVHLEFDVEGGTFNAEFIWHDAFEADLHLKEHGPVSDPVCWFLTGYSSGFTSYYMGRNIFYKEVECLGCGASHCRIVGKPAEEWEDREEFEHVLKPDTLADELYQLRSELGLLRDAIRRSDTEHDQIANSVGESIAFREASSLLQRAAIGPVSVLLQGETGVGKEIFARGLHLQSDRSDKPFVAVNCACIPPELIEAELFGVEKGAFTGAATSREGRFERANGGTLFLDEVVELTPRAQAALLRVLQEGELERVGGSETRKVDVRLVAATHDDLAEAVKQGRFRADLFYRLSVYPVHIPALRERKDDIPLLVNYFLDKYRSIYNKNVTGITDKAMQALMDHQWPGNIRELENTIERGMILTDNNRLIECQALFSIPPQAKTLNEVGDGGTLKLSKRELSAEEDRLCDSLLAEDFDLEVFETRLLRSAMRKAGGNVSQAARILGLTRPQLAYRLEKIQQ